MGHSKQCNFFIDYCTYYEAQEDTSERSGFDMGQNLRIQNVHKVHIF